MIVLQIWNLLFDFACRPWNIFKKKVLTVYVQNEINVLLDNYMLSALLQFKSAWNKFLLDVSGCIGVQSSF